MLRVLYTQAILRLQQYFLQFLHLQIVKVLPYSDNKATAEGLPTLQHILEFWGFFQAQERTDYLGTSCNPRHLGILWFLSHLEDKTTAQVQVSDIILEKILILLNWGILCWMYSKFMANMPFERL